MSYRISDYFILSSNCAITKGYNRSLIQDFSRNSSNFISNEYFDLIEYINRKKIEDVIIEIDDDSKNYFFDFLNFMDEYEYGLFVNDVSLFPQKTDNLYDNHVILKDCIIEIDNSIDEDIYANNLSQLDQLCCENIQIWIRGNLCTEFITNVLNLINNFDFLCIELCFENGNSINKTFLIELIDKYASVNKIFLFNTAETYVYNHISQHDNQYPMLMGQIIYVNHSLDANNCGVINLENLSLGVESQFKINKKFNGCLYKKIMIDTKGNLRNCPYINNKAKYETISAALTDPEFQKLWFIKKDDIEICKDCEFRYNCSDCRAFTTSDNILSKPLRCNYNPYTNKWN